MPDAPPSRLARPFYTVSGLTLCSRITGLARDAATARLFGDTPVGSAFAAAFAIPNLFRRLFGEGALSAAFLPAYASLTASDKALAHRFASLVLGSLVLATGLITLAIIAVLALLLARHDTADPTSLSLRLIILMLPFMPLVCVGAVLGGMLQVHGRFGPMAAQPIVLNLAILLAASLAWNAHPHTAGTVIALAVSAAGLVQVLWSLLALRPYARWTRSFAGVGDHARHTLARFAPAALGMGTQQVNTFIDVLIAMWPIWVGPTLLGLAYPLDERSNAVLFYAQRLYQFPLGVFGIAVATVAFPLLARHAHDAHAFARTLRDALRLSLFIGLPASVGLTLVAPDLIHVMYARADSGAGFSEEGARRATTVLLCYAPAVWVYSLNHVLTRAFFARGDTVTPLRVSLTLVLVNFILNCALIWTLREAGLALATALSALLQTALLVFLIRRKPRLTIFDPALRKAALRTVALSAAIVPAVLATGALPFPPTWAGHLWSLLTATAAGAAVYLLGAHLSRAPELAMLLRPASPPSSAPPSSPGT